MQYQISWNLYFTETVSGFLFKLKRANNQLWLCSLKNHANLLWGGNLVRIRSILYFLLICKRRNGDKVREGDPGEQHAVISLLSVTSYQPTSPSTCTTTTQKVEQKQCKTKGKYLLPFNAITVQYLARKKTFSEPRVLYFSFGRVFSIWYLVF